MSEENPWKILSSKTVYKNPWIRVREDKVITPGGSDGIYGVVESNDSVIILALNARDEVYIIRNFRYPAGIWSWELPGGGGDKQDALEASKRELQEETGITAGKWDKLGSTFVCNGLMPEKMATYLARELDVQEKPHEPDEPVIAGKFVGLGEIDTLIKSGEINDGQSITALYLLKQWLAANPGR
jgi:8-oxo-dGTP pyrophosphatase MutT (NUDIX family)